MTNSGAKSKLTVWYKNHPVIFFVLSFALMMGAFYVFYFSSAAKEGFFTKIVYIYANISSGLLNVMGYSTNVSGYIISSSRFSMGIKIGCDAVEPMAMFVAGIIAFPVSFRKKGWALLAGLAILFVLNLVRVCTLFIAGVHSQPLFETLHEVVWQIAFILIPVGLWLLWLQRSVRKPRVA